MLNVPSFSEDMLPRHFPKTKGQLEQKSPVAPMPTLPGLSLLLDDDNKIYKAEPLAKIEPRKSFEQWKQQHKAIFIDNATTPQRKSEKKHVRFESDNQTNFNSIDKPLHQRYPPPVSPNLELSYCEGSQGDNFCRNQQEKDYHQSYREHNSKTAGHSGDCEKNILPPRYTYKPTIPSFANDNSYNPDKTVDLPNFHRMVWSESSKENYLSGANPSVHSDQRQCRRHSCQTNQNHWEMMKYQTCNHGMQPNGCVSERQIHPVHQYEVEQKIVSPFNSQVERKEQLTDDTLLSIMEEQQQHILLQQSQIMMQQKQNMMQQNQIFMLQHQVQQLLLRNGTNPKESPSKLCQTPICEKPTPRTTTNLTTNVLENAIKIRNGSVDSVRNGTTARSSIGVMTSFLGNVNDAMPNGIQQFNERFSTKLANEKFIENMGGFSAEDNSHKDSMLDKINDAIKNSSMIDYRNNGTTSNGRASPNRQTDINIAAQALFYETSSTNNGCTNEQKTTDRSFALYMLGMKYDCAQDDSSKNVDRRDNHQLQTNCGKTNDQVSVNLSPEVYDYLKRHGLLKQE